MVCAAYLFLLELAWQWLTEIAIVTSIIAIGIAAVVLIIYYGKVQFFWTHRRKIEGFVIGFLIYTLSWKYAIPFAITEFLLLKVITSVVFNKVIMRGDIGINFCNWMISAARTEGSKALEGCGYSGLAFIFESRGDYDEAIVYLSRCLTLSKEMGDKTKEGLVYGALGDYFQKIGDLKTAEDHYKQQRKIVTELENTTHT